MEINDYSLKHNRLHNYNSEYEASQAKTQQLNPQSKIKCQLP